MKRVDISGKNIRLFFHTDLDGVISASLIKLFSGARIVAYVPCPFQNFPKPEKIGDVLDVFVDCRAKNRDEDIRIDHHVSGEDAAYLEKEGIIVDPSFKSAVSLVAGYLRILINEQILSELDNVDSGIANVFSKFTMDEYTISKILIKPGFDTSDYQDFGIFRNKLLSFMAKGFAIEDLQDMNVYEKKLNQNFGVIFEDVKKNGPLVKLIYDVDFQIYDSDFYERILSYVQQYYYERSKKESMGVYVIMGFISRNYSFDENLIKVVKNDHKEPYQIFVSRSHTNTSINIGELIARVKAETGITNGGGRDTVGGLNTSDIELGIKALSLLKRYIENNI